MNGQTIVLPGCRGVQSLTFDSGANVWRAVFDDGYDVAEDGCVFGTAPNSPPGTPVSLNGRAIVGTYADGTPVDLDSCGTIGPNQTTTNSRTRQAPVPVTGRIRRQLGPHSARPAERHGLRLWRENPLPPARGMQERRGCALERPERARLCLPDPGLRRRIRPGPALRTAQIFRSEIAAASWNLLQFLIVSSCDHLYDDVANDPECFQPQDPWRTEKCSFAAPQHCRNVQFLLALAPDDDGMSGGSPGCNQPPECSAAAASVDTLWPPNHEFAEVSIAGVTDEDGDAISITIDGIFQDEPVNAAGDGNTAPDGAGVGSDVASLRSESSPKRPGDGRVYHVAFSAEDGQGGACEGSVTVCVPHGQRKGGVCVDGGARFDSTRVGP